MDPICRQHRHNRCAVQFLSMHVKCATLAHTPKQVLGNTCAVPSAAWHSIRTHQRHLSGSQ